MAFCRHMRNLAAIQPARSGSQAFVKVLTPVFERRGWCAWIAGAGVAHLVLSSCSLPGAGCAFRELTGVPCPGCGLTRATLDLLHGRWAAAWATHPFAPLFLGLFALIVAAAVLPESVRAFLVRAIARVEARTSAGLVAGVALLLYWGLRTR